MVIAAIVLAAGRGERMGMPKALVHDADGSWLQRTVDAVRAGGCDDVVAVLGAGADEAAALIPDVDVVVAQHWQEGMGASLRTGLDACSTRDVDAALITLVDLPDVDARVVARVLAAAATDPRDVLVRATYDGVPGHPVIIGRTHWAAAADVATGDQGARALFVSTPHNLVECGHLATGRDVDTPVDSPQEFDRA